ncbi:MAG: hypothetical protein J4452_02735 [Candidatus Aenigmarchaeota archaeon]|nr:hypothetical protein [Candidatus Aenigmarchaeota archaeon]
MITLAPDFAIYGPPLVIFGGVKVQPPHNFERVPSDLRDVLYKISQSLYQAYEITSKILSESQLVKFIASPTTATLDERCRDYSIEDRPVLKNMVARMQACRMESAINVYQNGFHVAQLLKGQFDPQMTEYVLKVSEAAMLDFVGMRHKISSSVDSNCLRVDAKVFPPSAMYA